MGFILNVKNECEVCGKRVESGEKYCAKHKDTPDKDSADVEDISDDGDEDEDDGGKSPDDGTL